MRDPFLTMEDPAVPGAPPQSGTPRADAETDRRGSAPASAHEHHGVPGEFPDGAAPAARRGRFDTFPRHREGDPDTTGHARTPAKIRRTDGGQDRTPPDATSRHFPNPALAFGGISGDRPPPDRGTA